MPKMKKKEKGRGGAVSGALSGAIASLVLITTYAIIINKYSALSEYAEAVIIAINIIGALICGRIAAKGRRQNMAVSGLAAGAIYCIVIMLVALAISLDKVNAYGLCEIALISLGGSAVGAMLNLCKSNKKLRLKSKERKGQYRV